MHPVQFPLYADDIILYSSVRNIKLIPFIEIISTYLKHNNSVNIIFIISDQIDIVCFREYVCLIRI